MEFIDWIAVLGAMAWTPHLAGLLMHWLSKSKVRFITERTAEVGFTTSGPILNLRIALSVEKKDIVVSNLKLSVRHQDGETRMFECQGMTQQMGKMTVPNAGTMPFEKDNSVLAVKLNQKDIEERFVRFQDPAFLLSQRQYVAAAERKMAYLKSESKYDAMAFLREQEMTELYRFNRSAFSWKQGKYSISIEMQSPEKFSLVDSIREFTLSSLEIEKLEKNKDSLESNYKSMVVDGTEDDEKPAAYQWCNPDLTKPR